MVDKFMRRVVATRWDGNEDIWVCTLGCGHTANTVSSLTVPELYCEFCEAVDRNKKNNEMLTQKMLDKEGVTAEIARSLPSPTDTSWHWHLGLVQDQPT